MFNIFADLFPMAFLAVCLKSSALTDVIHFMVFPANIYKL